MKVINHGYFLYAVTVKITWTVVIVKCSSFAFTHKCYLPSTIHMDGN